MKLTSYIQKLGETNTKTINEDTKMEENIFQTYINMTRAGLFEERKEGTPLIVHHYTDSKGEKHGCLDRDKIDKMANGREIGKTHISDYHGHLMSTKYD